MLSQNNIFFGVLLLIVAAQGFEYIDDVIVRAQENPLHMSGKDLGKPVFGSEQMVVDVGKLNNETIRSLSDYVKITIAECYKLLEKNKTAKETLDEMKNNPILYPEKGTPETTKNLNDARIKDLDNWLRKLTNNNELLAAASKAGKEIFEKLKNSCSGDKVDRDMIDLTVTQFPQTKKNKEISVVHIKVTVGFDCKNVVGGINMTYETHKFSPREMMIKLDGDAEKKMIAGLEERFAEMEPGEITTKSPSTTSNGCSSNVPTPSVTCGGASWISSTALTFAAAAFTAFTIMKRNGDEEEEEDDEDDVNE